MDGASLSGEGLLRAATAPAVVKWVFRYVLEPTFKEGSKRRRMGLRQGLTG